MIWEELELVGLGFGVVVMVLIALWGTTAAVGQVFIRNARAEAAAKERAAQAAQVPQTRPAGAPADSAAAAPEGIPPHHLAAIGAAVAAVMPGRYRLVRVTIPPHTMPAWVNEGRFEHMSSHGGRANAGWAQAGPPHVDHPIHESNPLPSADSQQKRTP
ncbi:OadG family transporter subunit [Caenispirillum salinarum]|uniref:OadG family transporter subunit n=1 Tax=Caenispirillum salinarum TaxID=859058 RepID=UPI00384FA4BE